MRRLVQRCFAIVAPSALVLAIFAAAHAAVTVTEYSSYGACSYFGSSSFSNNPPDPVTISSGKTGKSSGTCNDQFHVHTYFWGSDSQYHYYEKTDYAATNISVVFCLSQGGGTCYWSNDVISYHNYPGVGSNFSTRAQ